MRAYRMSSEPTLLFRELSLSGSWSGYMVPTLTQAVRSECISSRSDGSLMKNNLVGEVFF